MRSIAFHLLLSACCGLTLFGCSGGPSSTSTSNPFAKNSADPMKSEESWWAKNKPSFLKSKSTPTFASQPDSSPDALSLATKAKGGPGIYIATAQVYEKSGNFPAAAENYEKALKADPNDLQALLGSARLLDRQNKLVEATAMYERAARAHPQSPAAHNDLALCYARRNMMNEAIDELNRAVNLAPNKALYRNNLATVCVHQNRLDEALQHLKAVHQEPIAYYNLGYLLQQQGQDELAMAQFTRAAQIDPNFEEARDWTQRIASRLPSRPGAIASAPATRPTAQLASLAAPPPRATLTSSVRSYERAPEPGPPPSYLQPQQSAGASTPSTAGSRYGASWGSEASRGEVPVARATDVSMPIRAPAPKTASSSNSPSGDAEYRFLPPVGPSY